MLGSVDARLYESALKIVLGLLAQEYGYRGGTISTDIKRDVDSGLVELGLSIDRKTLTRLRTHSQNITMAASAQADRKMSARRSKRMATRLQSFNRPNMFSIL